VALLGVTNNTNLRRGTNSSRVNARWQNLDPFWWFSSPLSGTAKIDPCRTVAVSTLDTSPASPRPPRPPCHDHTATGTTDDALTPACSLGHTLARSVCMEVTAAPEAALQRCRWLF